MLSLTLVYWSNSFQKARNTCLCRTRTTWELCKSTISTEEIYLALISPYSVDQNILKHMMESGAEFLMEVTDKTKADVKVTSQHMSALARMTKRT